MQTKKNWLWTLVCYFCTICRQAGPLFLLRSKLQAYRQCSWVFSGICLEKVDKRIRQRGVRGLEVTLSSFRSMSPADSSVLTDKSGLWSSPLSPFGVDRLRQKVCLEEGKSRRRSRLSQLLSQMDQRSAVCWMDECVHCVFALSLSAQTARLCTERQPEHTAGSRKWPWLCQMSPLPQCPLQWWIGYVAEGRCGLSALKHQSVRLSHESIGIFFFSEKVTPANIMVG